ncbi:DUF4270 family protein [Chryseobacterium sp. PTM-20240506]|uniref:DUF4270 family protein n=1 Tax=unclassified Chryseobacterium TaxID=2593645 RepID=UPI0023594221|nr:MULTISPECIES: DUF4270 family protein [unclassified Chryseobacterium]MDC8106806.1 DUF4270 domain-containing protein [Chryseobacterium sp. B21-037]MDQ1805916.1 DUF4270 family protein [Chryseobacterium sp. CKR4-1]
MTRTIKRTFAILSLAIFGSVLLYNCEPDPDSLGEQLFLDGAAQGKETSYNVIAFNILNNDSIKSDATQLGSAVLGAFKEDQFGMQKASYITQLRLSTYNPDFGANAKVDSVVLVIKPTYASDSLTTTTDENYVYPDGNVAAKKEVKTYPINKYGKAKKTFHIDVNEVTDFLGAATDSVKSNANFAYNSTVLGTKEFKGTINTVTITKDSDNSSLFSTTTPAIRIPLDNGKTLFQEKIIDKKGKPELADASNFIRHFKGLRISVQENDGYLFQFSPNDIELIMYYKYDKTDNGTVTRPQATYSFALGAGNTHVGQYQYDRSNSALATAINLNMVGNRVNGDKKLYAQGMGGPSIGVKIPDSEIQKLKTLYQNNKAAIISAKIRIYTDASTWNNSYVKPSLFTFLQKDRKESSITPPYITTTAFTSDVLTLAGSPNYSIYKVFDLDKNPTPAHYDFIVTKSVKDLVEGKPGDYASNNTNKYYRIDIGGFLSNSDNTGLAGAKYTSRSYTRDRAVFVGSADSTNDKRVQLIVTYGTK